MEGIRFSYRIRLRVNSTATPQEPSGLGSVRTTVPRAASRKAGATPGSAESRTATVTSTPKGISLITHMWSPPLLRLSSTECSVNTRPVLSTPFSLAGKSASIRAVSLRSFTNVVSCNYSSVSCECVLGQTKISAVRNPIKPIGCDNICPRFQHTSANPTFLVRIVVILHLSGKELR